MTKYIDKMNLPQFRYFQDAINHDKQIKELVAQYVAAEYLVGKGNKRDRAFSFLDLRKAARRFPDALFSQEADRERTRKLLSQGDVKRLVKAIAHYSNTLLFLGQFQGEPYNRKYPVSDSEFKNLMPEEIDEHFVFDSATGRYCRILKVVPKLILIEEALFENYLGAEWTVELANTLSVMISEDIFYIVNIQSLESHETAYKIGKNDSGETIICSLDRFNLLSNELMISKVQKDDHIAVLLSLMDYLSEIRKAHPKKADLTSTNVVIADGRVGRYITESSIKVFDLVNNADRDLIVYHYSWKRGKLTVARRVGYEVMPHVRRGHYRRYKSGKIGYVRSAVIHKDKYSGFQSAHRIKGAVINPTEGGDKSNE